MSNVGTLSRWHCQRGPRCAFEITWSGSFLPINKCHKLFCFYFNNLKKQNSENNFEIHYYMYLNCIVCNYNSISDKYPHWGTSYYEEERKKLEPALITTPGGVQIVFSKMFKQKYLLTFFTFISASLRELTAFHKLLFIFPVITDRKRGFSN
jgi:hypothetical protein